nr:hypothetical protein BaRGS_024529 [Batillaria attramentaria]
MSGIPISHQHLIWQSVELEDDYCLHDYQIHSGATLKLVLAMRGGPINTRRIPMEDTALREMAEYMEANKDEILDKLPDSRNVTLLVFREGDQLNFFRVVDRGDGTLTPLSESHSTSVFNLEEEEEELPTKEKVEENDKMKEKLDQLRVNMEKMSLTRKEAVELARLRPELQLRNIPLYGVVHETLGVPEFAPYLKGDGVFVMGPGKQGILYEYREKEFGDQANITDIVNAIRKIAPAASNKS